MLILGIQHIFAMFGATILVPILVAGYFQSACNEQLPDFESFRSFESPFY